MSDCLPPEFLHLYGISIGAQIACAIAKAYGQYKNSQVNEYVPIYVILYCIIYFCLVVGRLLATPAAIPSQRPAEPKRNNVSRCQNPNERGGEEQFFRTFISKKNIQIFHSRRIAGV